MGEYRDYADYKKRRLNGDERLMIMMLDMIPRSFANAVNILAERLAKDRYVKRDVGMVRSICKRLKDEALADQPADIEDIINRQSRDFRTSIERMAPVRKEEEVVMPMSDEWQFIHIVLESRCGLCLKTDAECKACKIRKLLRKYCDEPDLGLMSCGYRGCDMGDSAKINRQERL